MEQFSMKSLESLFQKEGYHCLFFEPTEEAVYPRLVLFVGTDRQNRERIIEISLKEQVQFNEKTQKVEEGAVCLLQFLFTFPFSANEVTLLDTVRFVAFLNRNYEMPGLEYDEVSGSIFYRHMMLLNKSKYDAEVFKDTVGIILLFLEMFSDAVEQVATGKKTTNEMLEAVVLASSKIL